jgi:hypothetical protein
MRKGKIAERLSRRVWRRLRREAGSGTNVIVATTAGAKVGDPQDDVWGESSAALETKSDSLKHERTRTMETTCAR